MDYPKTGKEAREKGINKYFTGIPCKFGHIAPRRAHNGQCMECGHAAVIKNRNTDKGKLAASAYYKKIRETKYQDIMWRSARRRAEKRKIPFEITPQDIVDIFPPDGLCPIFGTKLERNFDNGKKYTGNSPSLDRIIPSLGYIPGNIVIISMKANLIKNSETDPELFQKMAIWLEKNVKGA